MKLGHSSNCSRQPLLSVVEIFSNPPIKILPLISLIIWEGAALVFDSGHKVCLNIPFLAQNLLILAWLLGKAGAHLPFPREHRDENYSPDGLLYLLRFERVDKLGACSVPSETAVLIPSVFENRGNII